jgi:sirohydrochlorin cobaltochelatase
MRTPATSDPLLKDLKLVDQRIRTLLPPEYQESYESREPVPMRSAGLQYDTDGRVAWDKIWGSFCDLAMAGGPPHKGALLESATASAVAADPERYDEVAEEICRGIVLATDLDARASATPGWIRVACYSEAMAGWLLRAIVMENVAVRAERMALYLPAAPHFRLDREIKNVITVIAKTSHYWLGHVPDAQKLAIASLFTYLAKESPLIEPAAGESDAVTLETLRARVLDALRRDAGFEEAGPKYAGWVGVNCPSVRHAIWMMRALVVSNVLARREGTVLFVPIAPATDPRGERVAESLARIHAFAAAKKLS